MRIALAVIAAASLSLAASGRFASSSCRFASEYNIQDLVSSHHVQQNFIHDVLEHEGHYMKPGVGVNYATGVTYNGRPLDANGKITDQIWFWSAPSKEALHLNILARALLDKEGLITYPSRTQAVDILQRKINTYIKFDATYPGFGGFLPWYDVNDTGMVPTPDFASRVPSLDNGQMIWSMIAASEALHQVGEIHLAHQYDQYVQKLAKNALPIFYEGDGKIRAVSNIKDITIEPTKDNYYTTENCGDPCYLDDPYEGELFAFFIDLFSDWTSFGDREKVWEYKRAKFLAVDYVTPEGNITVQRGWWFSSHEQWKFMYLPYNSVPIAWRIEVNCERARTWNSFLNAVPGLYASVTEPCFPDKQPCPFNYISATGIQSIAAEEVKRLDVATPYGAMPVILANKPVGLAWYLNMLQAPGMQNLYGSTEALFINGTGVAPCLTWDSKITTAVAMLGGVRDLNLQVLKQKGLYARFHEVVNREFSRVFTDIKGENLPFKLPVAPVPKLIEDFTSCSVHPKHTSQAETL
jgi:hypothetical protein